jgi:hypothetical protein
MNKWKDVRIEDWKNGRLERWKNGKFEEWEGGTERNIGRNGDNSDHSTPIPALKLRYPKKASDGAVGNR